MGAEFPTCAENASQKNVRGALLFSEALPQFAVGEMVTASGAVFLAPFRCASIVFIVEKVVFSFFPVDDPAEPFAHIPLVLVDGMAVLPNLPFIEITMSFAAA